MSALLLTTAPAQALPGGPWPPSGYLTFSWAGWSPVGYGYGTWQGVREDQNRGSRVQDWSATKTRVTNHRGTYVHHNWFANTNNCYMTSFESPGFACSTGWFGSGSGNSGSNNSTTTWMYWENWDALDPKGSSARGQMSLCVNTISAPDPCSTVSYIRGSDY